MHFYYFFVIVSNKTIFLILSDLHLNFEKCVRVGPPTPIAGYGCALFNELLLLLLLIDLNFLLFTINNFKHKKLLN